MMATEATSVNTVKTSSSFVELIYPSKDLSKNYDNVSKESGSKYGQSNHDLDLETKSNSASVSVCGGSDTENLKVENLKSECEEKGHTRTTSIVKRPISFKPVSVNKKFLAAKGSTSTTTSKLVDKSHPGSIQAQIIPLAGGSSARPRLVAKSGPSLHATPRAVVTPNGSRAGSGPDANAVWNKNRPAPPPEPKRYSDEELKQRYGIHLARRLESDNAGKQANWADIDDDDDDWAPNTMEWADGTKVTLPQVDEILTPAPIANPVLGPVTTKGKDPEFLKSRSSMPTKILASSQTVRPTAFSGRAGLVLKGATENSDLISKLPGPSAVVKSPWAPLPPIEKTAPIITEASQLQQSRQTRIGQRDLNNINTLQLTSAKEIAADDFRRTWRDSPNGSRELYNAQSGRYEPANDKRRGSLRNETRPQQPSVLQRSHPENPAEPSPAFQTHRTAGQEDHSRRRNSSNVSITSDKAIKRMSRREMPPPPLSPSVRKGSIPVVGDEPTSPSSSSQTNQQQPNQHDQQSHTWQPRASSIKGHSSPQPRNGQLLPSVTAETTNNVQPIVYEDLFEVQKKAMQIKRELAIARRREQEEKEALEKEERIRIKLASMGPSPENLKKEPARQEKQALPQAQTRGLTKLTPNEKNITESDSIEPNLLSVEPKEKKPIVTNVESNLAGKKQNADLRSNSNNSTQGVSTQTQLSQDTPPSQSWNNNNSERFKPWAPAPSQQTSSRNVWGSPTNDRTLGNGTFNPELSRLPEISPHPSQIGPITSDRGRSRGQTQDYSSRPAPIGPPNRRHGQKPSQESEIRSAVAISGWGSLPNKIAEEDALQAKRQEIEMSRIRDLRDKGLLVEPQPPVVHDTWRQVSMKKNGTRSKIESNNTTIHNEPAKPWKDQDEPISLRRTLEDRDVSQRRPLDTIGTQQEFSDAWKVSNINAPPIRDSRFFPNNRDIRTVAENVNLSLGRPESPSPPPPTQLGHPAYEGDSARPHVSLPRPPPIVKLPPLNVLAPIGPPKPASFAAVVATPVLPTVNRNAPRIQPRNPQTWDARREKPVAGNWQDKINSLIGRKCSPSKPNLPAVDSSSKKALGIPLQHKPATVLLPSLVSGDFSIEIGSVQSKPASEVCFEEQEMGSLPPIKLPLKPPTAAWNLAPSPKPLPKKFMLLQSTSIEPLVFSPPTTNGSVVFIIKFPGQIEPKNVLLHVTRYRFSTRRSGTRAGTNLRYSSSSNQRIRGRDSSSTFPPSNLDHVVATSDLNPANRGRNSRQSSSWKHNSVTTVQS